MNTIQVYVNNSIFINLESLIYASALYFENDDLDIKSKLQI